MKKANNGHTIFQKHIGGYDASGYIHDPADNLFNNPYEAESVSVDEAFYKKQKDGKKQKSSKKSEK